jgi:hypothetical protein
VRFVNNQDGLMAIDQPQSTVRVEHCLFEANGVPGEERPTAALIAGQVDRLVVYGTRFEPGRGGAVVRSSARATEITRSELLLPQAPRGVPVQVDGGLVLEDSAIEAGPLPGGRRAAILALPAPEPDSPLVLRSNRLENDGTLLLNWSGRAATLEGNQLRPGSEESSTSGAWSHRIRGVGWEVYASVRHLAGAARRRLLTVAGDGG